MILEYKNLGVTILLASHNESDINLLCDEVYEMDNGKLSSQKTNESVKFV